MSEFPPIPFEVECIDNVDYERNLAVGQVYRVIDVCENYTALGDTRFFLDKISGYWKVCRFKLVEGSIKSVDQTYNIAADQAVNDLLITKGSEPVPVEKPFDFDKYNTVMPGINYTNKPFQRY